MMMLMGRRMICYESDSWFHLISSHLMSVYLISNFDDVGRIIKME